MARQIIKSEVYPAWSRSKFFTFIRSGLRRLWSRWPPKYELKKKVRRKNQSTNRKLKWEYQCKKCTKWFADKLISVDHIVACGTLLDYNDLPNFVKNLLCGEDNLQVLCKKCHQSKTTSERIIKKGK